MLCFLAELDITDHHHQVESLHEGKFIACHLRFTIKSGYDHVCAVYRVEVQGTQNRSGGDEIRHDETAIHETVGPVTTLIRQGSRNSPVARANEMTHTLNPFQSIQQTSKSGPLGDGTGRLVGQSPRERGSHIMSSMVPPLWNENEKGEETVSPNETTNRMVHRDSDDDANH
jgi:hypothetical protein